MSHWRHAEDIWWDDVSYSDEKVMLHRYREAGGVDPYWISHKLPEPDGPPVPAGFFDLPESVRSMGANGGRGPHPLTAGRGSRLEDRGGPLDQDRR